MPDQAGDAACWAAQVCDGCGAPVAEGSAHRCTRVVDLGGLRPGAGGDGVVWSLAGERQLDINLVVLGPGGAIRAHRNDAVDVCLVVLAGSVTVVVDGVARPLGLHELAFVPRGAEREIVAGGGGARYVSAHVARPGPSISTP